MFSPPLYTFRTKYVERTCLALALSCLHEEEGVMSRWAEEETIRMMSIATHPYVATIQKNLHKQLEALKNSTRAVRMGKAFKRRS